MNIRFFLLLISFVLLNCSGSDLRLDVRGLPHSGDMESPNAKVRSFERGGEKVKSVVFTAENDWQPFEAKVRTGGAKKLVLSLRSTSDVAVLLDDLTLTGGVLGNGDFEKSVKDRPAAWKGSKDCLVTDPGLIRSGKGSGRVRYKEQLTQEVKVSGPELVIRGFFRAEKTVPKTFDKDANIVFDPLSDRTVPFIVSTGRLELVPTFENCGVYVNRLPGERGKKLKAAFFFRKQGTEDFQEALPPSEVRQENAWRGSLLHLEENTSYDVKVVITGEGNYRSAGCHPGGPLVPAGPGQVRSIPEEGAPGVRIRRTQGERPTGVH